MLHKTEMESFSDCGDSKSAGRWTSEEHNLFLQGLKLYNKQWKLIADLVKTRTVVQIRTHAQKYFQKLEKGRMINTTPKKEDVPQSPISITKVGSRANSITSADGYEFPMSSASATSDEDSEKSASINYCESLLNEEEFVRISIPVKPKMKPSSGLKRSDSKKRIRDVNDMKYRQAKRSNSSSSNESSLDCSSESSDPLLDFLPLEWDSAVLDEHITIMLDKFDWNAQVQESYSLEHWNEMNPATFFDVIESGDSSFRQYVNELKPTHDQLANSEDLFMLRSLKAAEDNSFDYQENGLDSSSKKRGRPRKNSATDERMISEHSLVLDVIFDSHISDPDSA